jgi:hypothetical protein
VGIGESAVLGRWHRCGARAMLGNRRCGMIVGRRRRFLTRISIVRADEADNAGDDCA